MVVRWQLLGDCNCRLNSLLLRCENGGARFEFPTFIIGRRPVEVRFEASPTKAAKTRHAQLKIEVSEAKLAAFVNELRVTLLTALPKIGLTALRRKR